MAANGNPTASIIIPVYNDPEGIRMTLESMTDQTYPNEEYEILVVDNDSDDETPDVIDEYRRRYPDLVSKLEERRVQSSYAARNEGIRNADGSILVFTDADMTADRTWLGSVVDLMENNSWDYMSCDVEVYTPEGEESIVSKYAERYHFNMETLVEEHGHAQTCSLVVSAEVFDEVGMFDPRLVSIGDMLFGKLVDGAGFEQHFEPSVPMRHPARTTWSELHARYVRFGRGYAQLNEFYGIEPPYSVTNVYDYLPPNPRLVFDKLRQGSDSLSYSELILFYFVEYFIILSRLKGQYKEIKSEE